MKKALIIDDTKNIRIMLTKCLELSGYVSDAVQNGIEGLELIESQSYDLIFLDIKLTELSGTEVLKRIRKKGINTPVVIITAYATIKNAGECTKLGAVSYLQKPFTAERLKNTIDALNISNESFSDYFDKALSLFSENPLNPDIYSILSDAYRLKGEDSLARKCSVIRDIMSE